ncbi:MAG: DUF2141 domain-containing protein [Spirochaetes bacterium]|jgi:uncharacterized protein (DUF2141 family)|nr:DUF2141 domain-containing protein [Spirochaetota bacterium]
MKRHAALLGLMLVVAISASAGAEHVVAGTISGIEEDGELFVAIFDERGWKAVPDFQEGFVEGRSYQVESASSVDFRIDGVPPGMYAVRAFLDTNGNQELDMGMFGPKEPWGVYKASGPIVGPPRFRSLAFEVSSDVKGAEFQLR